MTTKIAWALLAGLIVGQVQAQAATLSGVVFDEQTGEPLPAASLALERENICWQENIFEPAGSVTTDENGAFSATGLEAGNYQLVVRSTPRNQFVAEAYDNVSAYDLGARTTIPLVADEVRDDIVIELAKRPLYIEEVRWQPQDLLERGGRGKAFVTVRNTMGRSMKMRFWLDFDVNRQEGNLFDDTDALVPAMLPEGLHTLAAGSNTVVLAVKLPLGIGERTHLEYTITGGLNRWQPMLPAWSTIHKWSLHPLPICRQPPIVTVGPLPPSPPPPLTIPTQGQGTHHESSGASWTMTTMPPVMPIDPAPPAQ